MKWDTDVRNITILILFISLANLLTAQPLELDQDVFAKRRAIFMDKIDSSAVAIFPSKPVYQRNLDVDYPYRQESNFYYLSGFNEPKSLLILNPSAEKYKYILYVQENSRYSRIWSGPRAGSDEAVAVFRADTALSIDSLEQSLIKFIGHDRPLYYTFGINEFFDRFMEENFIKKRHGANWQIIDPAPILSEMRLIKNDHDFEMGLTRAIDISADAHLEVIRALEPGMYEYELQAIFEYVYRKKGSPRNGYPCIIGSGPNATILHYEQNSRKIEKGDLVLMDCAAEYGFYSADITRTVPASGEFTKEQREIYQLVLNAQRAAMEMVKPGITLNDLEKQIDEIFVKGLFQLGLIKDKNEARLYSVHGYSHWIGLEVHDVGAYRVNNEYIPLQEGMVFTIEPGLYFRPEILTRLEQKDNSEEEMDMLRENFSKYVRMGVRIEDDILVTEDGYINLSEKVPCEIEEIEELMEEDPEFVLPR